MSFYNDHTTYRSFCIGAATQRLPAATVFPGKYSTLTTNRSSYRGDPSHRPLPATVDDFRNTLAGPDGTYVPPEFYPPRYPVDTYAIADTVINRENTYHLTPSERLNFSPEALASIDRARADVNRTIYQVHYGRLEDGYMSTKSVARASKALAKTTKITPEVWDIPLSTQRVSYRDPRSCARDASELCPVRVKPNAALNMGPFAIFQRVKNGVTGDSEYQGVHGLLGACIANVRRTTHVKRKSATPLEEFLLEHEAQEILKAKPQDQDMRAAGDKGYNFEGRPAW